MRCGPITAPPRPSAAHGSRCRYCHRPGRRAPRTDRQWMNIYVRLSGMGQRRPRCDHLGDLLANSCVYARPSLLSPCSKDEPAWTDDFPLRSYVDGVRQVHLRFGKVTYVSLFAVVSAEYQHVWLL